MSARRRLASQWPRVAVGVLGAAAGLLGLSTAPACSYGPAPSDECETDEDCVDDNGPGWVCDRADGGTGDGDCVRKPDGGR